MTLSDPHIAALFIAPKKGQPQISAEEVLLIAGQGIAADRHCRANQKYPGQNLTLIEQEEIEHYNRTMGQNIGLDATRRNLITRNLRLNELVGREFQIGEALLRGVELCEPCKTLGSRLANESVTAAQVIKAFVHRGGLRVDVVRGGKIRRGDRVEPVIPAPG